MKKIRDYYGRDLLGFFSKQTIRVMKLTLFLSILTISQLWATETYSQFTKLTLKLEDVKISDALKEIENQSEFFFLYSPKLIDVERKVNIDAEKESIKDILSNIFDEKVKFVVYDRQIILSPGDMSAISDAKQQQQKIAGTVTEKDGAPLTGVNVVVTGTTVGVITDIDGKYSIDVPEGAKSLTFTFIGMQVQEISIGTLTQINVTMAESAIGLDEVVVIGYGTAKKADLTGAVSSVNEKSVKNEPIQRMEQMLQGRVSGVNVTNTSGAPDGDILIRVRGANSINAGNDPLYVVDGVANQDMFKILDVNDIQSIEVLKDASSTAIYGSRGANGVILVTTKKGSLEKSQMQFETQQSWGTAAKKYDMLKASEFANFYNEYRKIKGATDDFYSAEQISDWGKNGGYDWQDIMFQTAYTQNYKLSASGGSSKVRYLISGNVRDADGILIKSNYKKYGLRANVNVKTFDWLNINLDVNGSHDESAMNRDAITGVGGSIWDLLTYSPTVGLMDENGDWITDNVSSYQKNPYGRRMQDKDDRISNYFTGNARFTIQLPVKGLTLDLLGSANYMNRMNYSMTSKEHNLHPQSAAYNNQDEYLNWQNTNQLTYTNKWGVHALTATFISEYIKETSNYLNVSVNDLLTESVGYRNLGLGAISNFANGYGQSTLASYLGRVMYQLMDKYLITGTLRRDGSSKFQGDNKWGYFPSLAFAWRVSEEKFLKENSTISNFKVRTSWGVTGNQGIGAYSTLGLLSNSNYSWGTDTAYPGYWAANTPTPDLTWEKTYQWDVGLDLGFLKDRIVATIDLYTKTTKDLLLQKAIPYYDGGGSVYMNLGSVRNNGLDLSLNVIPVSTRNLNWSSSITFAYSKNEILEMGGDTRLFPGDFNNIITFNPHVLEVGQPLGSLWGYTWLGLWSTDEAVEAAKFGQQPGDNKFLDRNSDHVINSDDQGIIGKAFPDYTFGWNNTITWKKFEFNLFLQGAVGLDRINITRYGITESISDARFITSSEGYYNMWTVDNQDTNVPNPYSSTIKTNAGSTQYLESADFLRVKNLSIGYNLPLKGNNIMISFSVQNLHTFTSYSGYDPETTSSGVSDTRAGIESGAYPVPRTFTMGLKADF